ncbi:MAG: secretin N-terminal domain-containing protein [Candidatus Omnitrophota bacterium]
MSKAGRNISYACVGIFAIAAFLIGGSAVPVSGAPDRVMRPPDDMPDQPFMQESAPQNPPLQDEGAVQNQPGGKKISLDIKGMEITDLLKMLSLKGGVNIVAGKNVRGKVTIFLKDVDFMDALEIILVSNELAYDMKGNIINVMTDRDYEAIYGSRFQENKALKIVKLKYCKAAEISKALNQIKSRVGKIVVDDVSNTIAIMDSPQVLTDMELMLKEMDMPTVTRVFALNYARADTVKTKLEPLLTKGIGTIQLDERTNKVIVTDLEENIKTIENAVMEFDEKTKEVLIDAKILQITLNDEYQAGINWDAVFSGVKTQLGMNFSVLKGSPIPTTAGSAITGGGIHIGDLSSRSYEAMVQFLQTYGKTNLLASPRIIALNNEEAKILVGKKQPYATSTSSQSGTGTTLNTYQITFIDLGIELHVIPTINRDGFVTMKVKPGVSSTTQNYTYGDATSRNTVPIVNKSEAETTVMVKDGNTIVIAGLIENRDQEEVNKVPGLGDLPLIGGLFRNRTRGSVGDSNEPEKNELIVFLTPHIISGDVMAPEVAKYRGLTRKLERQLTQAEIKNFEEEVESEASAKSGADAEREAGLAAASAQARPQPEAPAQKGAPAIDTYFEQVRSKILGKVQEELPQRQIKGEVHLSFCIMNNGTLKALPSLVKPADPVLLEAALKAIRAAEPFPPFPAYYQKKEKVFTITIMYE